MSSGIFSRVEYRLLLQENLEQFKPRYDLKLGRRYPIANVHIPKKIQCDQNKDIYIYMLLLNSGRGLY